MTELFSSISCFYPQKWQDFSSNANVFWQGAALNSALFPAMVNFQHILFELYIFYVQKGGISSHISSYLNSVFLSLSLFLQNRHNFHNF